MFTNMGIFVTLPGINKLDKRIPSFIAGFRANVESPWIVTGTFSLFGVIFSLLSLHFITFLVAHNYSNY